MENQEKPKFIPRIVLISGILLLALGIAHSSLLYWEYNNIKTDLPNEVLIKYMAWFFILGIYLKLLGIFDLMSIKGLRKNQKMAWNYVFVSSIFKIVGTTIALTIIQWEPGPPYMVLILGILCFIPLAMHRKQFIN
jgi:hypothetical protein